MASRGYSFFARRDEATEILDLLVDRLRLVLIKDDDGPDGLEVSDTTSMRQLDPREPARYELARSFPTNDALHEELVSPAKWGWVTVDLPQERDGTLLLATLAAKTDWADEDGIRQQNDAVLALFDDVRRAFKSKAKGRILVRNLVTGATGKPRDVGILPGARAWVAAGGQLRQEGAKNIAFELGD